MVTVRTYWSPAEAALAKCLLDNYEISCALLDENSSVYSRGGQFAVPIRLAVDENEVKRAVFILNGDFEEAAKFEIGEEAGGVQIVEPIAANDNRNPWELLVLAFYLALPAIFVLRTKYSGVTATSSWTQYVVARARISHFLSWLAILLAVALVVEYFRVRRSSLKLKHDSAV